MGLWIPQRANRAQLAVTAQGLIAETFSRLQSTNNLVPPTQSIQGCLLGLRVGDRVTNCHCDVSILGAGTAPTLIKMALLDKTGRVLGQSANLAADAMWTTGLGAKTVPLAAPVTITADDGYYVAFLINGVFVTTNIQLSHMTPVTSLVALGTGVVPGVRQVSQTDFAATNSSQTLSVNGQTYWFAVS